MADTVHPNIALVQRMYECFNRNDMDTIRREIFAPDLVWNLPGRHPLAGTKHGAEEVLAFFAQLVKANIQVTLDPASDPNTGVDTFGDSTVVEVHRGHGTTSVRDASGNESQIALNAYNCTQFGEDALGDVYLLRLLGTGGSQPVQVVSKVEAHIGAPDLPGPEAARGESRLTGLTRNDSDIVRVDAVVSPDLLIYRCGEIGPCVVRAATVGRRVNQVSHTPRIVDGYQDIGLDHGSENVGVVCPSRKEG